MIHNPRNEVNSSSSKGKKKKKFRPRSVKVKRNRETIEAERTNAREIKRDNLVCVNRERQGEGGKRERKRERERLTRKLDPDVYSIRNV